MKSSAPSLAECYRVLGVPQSASLDEIKHAYRTKAFALHPDLNPDAGASRQFQQLNEAYVILIRYLDSRAAQARPNAGPTPNEQSARKGQEAYKEQQRREQKEKERREWQEAERQAREREAQKEKEQREAERREWLRREIERQEAERLARQEQAKQEKIRQQEARKAAEREREEKLRQASEQKRPEAYRRNYSYTHTATGSPVNGSGADSTASGTAAEAHAGTSDAKRESLLQDLLNDPFARRVYEDIYSEIQQRKQMPAEPPKPKKISMEWGDKNFQLDLTTGLGGAIKGWMRSQIDEEQELFFPASHLFPGARIRLQIRQGFSREPHTLEVTLPQDFAVGKPVRLKGMGKKIGRWQGDLYLTFRIKK